MFRITLPHATRLLAAGLLLSAIAPATTTAAPDGFRPLFNGRDLDGWFGWATDDPRKLLAMDEAALAGTMDKSMENINRHWRVEDGELINDGEGLYLSTREFFADFELRLEYRTVAKADSGIYLRGCPQVQIWDPTEEAKFKHGADKGSGGLWNNSPGTPGRDPLKRMDRPFGEWNEMRILMVGEKVSVQFNGEWVVKGARMENHFDRSLPVPARGPIQLQTHGGEIRWRNLFIRDIGYDEANDLLREWGGPGFDTIFNGKDFTGWTGAIDVHEIKEDGILACKKGAEGNLVTEKQYADFIFRFDYRASPGGNSGVAARSPVEGTPAWDGFEIQILDDNAEKYAELRPYQYHGSLYALVPAIRGSIRPAGEWNHMQVMFKGDRIEVETNGYRIVAANLSEIPTEGIERIPKGLKNERGHVGFTTHNDPFDFRNIELKSLDPETTPQP